MPRTLKNFLNIHAGETAWIFGKGPSLDSFDMATAGPLRCAVNDVVRYVPDCRYCFANDPVNDWAHLYAPDHVLFQPSRTLGDGFLNPTRDHRAELVTYEDLHCDERLTMSREQLADGGLSIRRGTLGSVIQILHIMGVREVVCVGIDGGGRHADKQFLTRLRANHAEDYNAIREAFILAAKIMGIRVRFHNAPDSTTQENGLMLIKITDSTLVAGRHYSAGEIIEALPSDAQLVIGCGRAIPWKAPVAPVAAALPAIVETADAAPAAERADAPPAKRQRRTSKNAAE